ncbi:MAG: CDP-glycerol glycerophosphotransferase family protein [Nocardioides sp.]
MDRSRLREVARRGLGLVPARQRAALLRTFGDRVGLAGHGLVTVVVVAEPGDRLADCLASLRAQTHALLDVVVCPVGAAAVRLPDDPRIRFLPAAATWYDAANRGLAEAYGDAVMLVRGCDAVPPDGVETLASTLHRESAAAVTGDLAQQGEAERWLTHTQASLPVLATVLLRTPTDLRLTADDDWLCSPSLARLLAGIGSVPVPRPVVRWAHERGRRAFGARPSPLPELDRWERLGRTLSDQTLWPDVLLPRFVADAERASPEQWTRLVALAQGAGLDGSVHVASRTLLWLAAQDRRTDVEALAAELAGYGEDLPTQVVDGEVVATWRSVDVPAGVARLVESETPLVWHVQRVRPDGAGTVVDLFARIRGVDLAGTDPALEARLDDGTRLAVERRTDATANRWARACFQSAGEGAWTMHVPAETTSVNLRMTVGDLSRDGAFRATAAPCAASGAVVVSDIWLSGESVIVRGTGPLSELRLTGPGVDVPAGLDADGDARFDTRTTLFGREVWLPTGRYRLTHPGGVGAAAAWRGSLPVESVGGQHRLRVLLDGPGAGVLHLGPPLVEAELGAYGQERLRASYAASDRPTNPRLFYFESYAGRSATDSPLAVFEELSARRPDLTFAWGVLDRGQWVPPGAKAVVLRTAEWYDVLARARCLVTNTELEEWYVRRPDQYVVQCFHGYPSKAMGLSQWQARELPPSRVAVMRHRSVDTWDLILTPTPAMTQVYREAYRYTGAAAEHGYPRNDALTAPAAADVRRDSRALLDIGEHQTAVLYAPTWRDHLATRPRAAAMSEFLDVPAAARALGDSHVLLVRGHRFHSATTATQEPGAARVIDVTAYPEVNDLILASDVAVLDYSSMRFDYALTGKPMVFLVPDLADYTAGVRGFLFPFEDTAPGPFVTDTAGVVDAVRDVPALARAWAERVRAFDATYNPWQDGHASARVADSLPPK